MQYRLNVLLVSVYLAAPAALWDGVRVYVYLALLICLVNSVLVLKVIVHWANLIVKVLGYSITWPNGSDQCAICQSSFLFV